MSSFSLGFTNLARLPVLVDAMSDRKCLSYFQGDFFFSAKIAIIKVTAAFNICPTYSKSRKERKAKCTKHRGAQRRQAHVKQWHRFVSSLCHTYFINMAG